MTALVTFACDSCQQQATTVTVDKASNQRVVDMLPDDWKVQRDIRHMPSTDTYFFSCPRCNARSRAIAQGFNP